MYNKDSLKPRNGRKLNNVIAVLMSALLATGVMIGCGSDSGGTKNSDSGGGTSNVAAAETVSDSVTEVSTNEAEDELPPQAYKTTEERQAQHVLDEQLKPMFTNQFLMIEEVINEPDEGWDSEAANAVMNDEYIKLKGTLYEVYYYDEPADDLVYFPGDELPEGYEVKTTDNYEVAVADTDLLGDGHELCCPSFMLATESDGEIVYEHGFGYIPVSLVGPIPDGMSREDAIKEYGHIMVDITFKPGMYVLVIPPSKYTTGMGFYDIAQLLTKEDLEKLPAGTTIAHGVGHY